MTKLIKLGANVDWQKPGADSTPLLEAASGGHTDVVTLLIQARANPNFKTTSGQMVLDYAKGYGYDDIVKVLEDAGAVH